MTFENWVKARLGAVGKSQAQMARDLGKPASAVNRAILEKDDKLRDEIREYLAGVDPAEAVDE